MALDKKYAALPDLDSAPDIYETPELTDDTSTLPATTVRSPSDDEDLDEDDATGIYRTRLRVDQARARFMPSAVDARETDFSDRVNGKRKSYKASSRRQRTLEDGTEEYGELSDDEDGEVNLTRKLARLKREIEEAKEEYGKQKAAADTGGDAADHERDIASLSQALDEIARFPATLPRGAISQTPAPARQAADQNQQQDDRPQPAPGAGATYTVTYAPTYEETHALAKAADFDRRLVLLEKSLGVGPSALPELGANGLPRAVLPALDTLQKQVSTLSEASTSSLDSISRRVRTLAQEADNLEKSRRNAKAARDALASTGAGGGAAGAGAGSGENEVPAEDSEQAAKINALYGTLPTIESLTPLLPPLLDRLRSLRTIHADAATASETLERLEKTQADMAAEIKQWRGALEKVEGATRDGDTALDGNMKVVEGWVKELEERMGKMA